MERRGYQITSSRGTSLPKKPNRKVFAVGSLPRTVMLGKRCAITWCIPPGQGQGYLISPKMNHLHHYTSHLKQQGSGLCKLHIFEKQTLRDTLHPKSQRGAPAGLGCFRTRCLCSAELRPPGALRDTSSPSAVPLSAHPQGWHTFRRVGCSQTKG